MIERRRKRNVDDPSFISFLMRVYIEPLDESDIEGWSDGKNYRERICARVIKDNLPLLSLALVRALSIIVLRMCVVRTSTQIRTT